MGRMIFDILETNIVVSVGAVLLCLFADRLRRRYGAGWMKLAWILLTVRLLIPYNISSPFAGIRLLNYAGFEQNMGTETENTGTGPLNGMEAGDGTGLLNGMEAGDGTGLLNDMLAGDSTDVMNNMIVGDSTDPLNSMLAGDGSGQENSMPADGNVWTDGENAAAGRVGFRNGTQEEPLDHQAVGTTFGQDGSQAAYIGDGQAGGWNTEPAGQAGSQATEAGHGIEGQDSAADSNTANGILSARTAFFYTNLLIKIWIAGVVVSLLYFLCTYLLFCSRFKKNLHPVTDVRLIRAICRQQKKYTGRAKIMVYKSSTVSSPMLTGLIHPKLVLPADTERWHISQLELIMAHELCHYCNKDLWLKMLMAAACCVNWFNPMVYVMRKQFAYDMELACDGIVLEGRDDEERENYARIMLHFAGGRRGVSEFSTGFSGKRKQMKTRIDYMLDTDAKKRGILSIVIVTALILIMGFAVSCGYKADGEGTAENSAADAANNLPDGGSGLNEGVRPSAGGEGSASSENPDGMAENLAEQKEFDYNHVYNDAFRVWQGDLYLAKNDGIYCLQGSQGEEQLIYSNAYEEHMSRGMEIDGKYLYFCGRAPDEKEDNATVYRMDLETREVVDALAAFNLAYPDYLITNVSVYEGNMYVAVGAASERFGFVLNENGEAVEQLDQQAEDFLYREYNEYMRAEIEWLNSEYDSEEYWQLAEEQNQRYLAVLDVASAKKLLDGRQVVSQYKDESLRSIYLENEDGTYEYLCDTTGFPMLVTDKGIYYPDITGEIWYENFETKQAVRFYGRQDREQADPYLITYDADYIYLLENKDIGVDMEDNNVAETYIVRVPITGGEVQKVYRFQEQISTYGENGWYRHCGVYDGRMYFDNRESISLDPEVNHMQAVNSGEPCEDAVEITRTIRAFADAYFGNDEAALRGLLTEDFEGEPEMYAYPGQADQIWVNHIGGRGIPDENIAVGVTCYVYYEFGGHAEAGDALAYLSMQVTKTEEGFRVRWYGIEM